MNLERLPFDSGGTRPRDDSMSTTRPRKSERVSPALGCNRIGSRIARLAVHVGCVLLSLILMAPSASAHVKWFVVCNIADDPLPIGAVFTTTFFLCAVLFLTLLYFACEIEQTAFGAAVSRLLDRCTGPLHRRTDEILRAVAAVSFALLWADGGLILTPELKGSGIWLSAVQVLIPLYLFARATLPAAGAGILVLYGYGAVIYGPFHMLDYPVFLGLGAYFALSVSQSAKLLSLRLEILRWAVALSLLWPSMEKFVYPGWVAPIAITHPELTLGFPVATVITAAGVVEFGLAFALFWTPLIRRLAALALALLMTAATFDFGKVDGIGHLMIIIILLVVFAAPGTVPARCRPLLAPLASSATWLATIFAYTGAHALYYGSRSAALIALGGGAATLAFIFLCLQGRAHVSSATRARPRRPYDAEDESSADPRGESPPGASPEGIQETLTDVLGLRERWREFAGEVRRGAINRYRTLWSTFSNRAQME
jgi:hypothetical protein